MLIRQSLLLQYRDAYALCRVDYEGILMHGIEGWILSDENLAKLEKHPNQHFSTYCSVGKNYAHGHTISVKWYHTAYCTICD